MTKLTKVEKLLKKGETYYANRVHIDIYGKGVIAGFHSRDEEVRILRDTLTVLVERSKFYMLNGEALSLIGLALEETKDE